MCCGGGAPAPDPMIGQAAALNAKTAAEALDFYKGIYQSNILPMQQKDQELRAGLIGDLRSSMQQQQDFAKEQNNEYKTVYQPLEHQMVSDAENYDSAGNVERRSGIASANVKQQFSNAQNQGMRSLSRYGVGLNPDQFARENTKLMTAQALGTAGAETGAAFDTQDKAIALRAGAANFGRNMPNTAATYYGLSNSTANNAAGISTGGINNGIASAGVMGQGFNTNIAGNSSAGNLMLGDFQGRMQGYAADQASTGAMFSGMGSLAGMGLMAGTTGGGSVGAKLLGFKDGGHIDGSRMGLKEGGGVHGAGGPVDDRIPAMLSDGEYVIPADVVKAKGVEFFDRLKDKYHTPAHLQRMGLRGRK